ncbi:MAG: hypothetical protein R6U43_09425 [Candidatus Krumholzibacteriales bacterium]
MNIRNIIRAEKLAVLIILSASLVISYNYFHFVERPNITERMVIHDSILEGEAPSPYRYRVLVPFATQGMTDFVRAVTPLSYRNSWILSYIIYDLAAIFLFISTLYFFLMEWHQRIYSLAGALFCCAVLPLSLRDHYFQPWSLIESWFFCAAFLAARKKNYYAILALTLAASLNRMSGLFIPLIYLASFLRFRDTENEGSGFDTLAAGKFLLLAAVSAGTILTLRYLMGWSENIHSIRYLWGLNRTFPYYIYAIINIVLFGGAWWFFFAAGIKYADRFTVSMFPVILLYLLPVAIFGIWKEVRLLLPVYPVLISTGLFYLRQKMKSNEAGIRA